MDADFKVSGAAGLGAILLSALCSGVFVSGDRFRGNHDAETKEHGEWNSKLANALAISPCQTSWPPEYRSFRLLTSDSE
ncbi:DUF5316 domain-containing protein [Bacillus licheniformis]|nr:DUF5316 domain-containing protein [Bacillus licheniformis]